MHTSDLILMSDVEKQEEMERAQVSTFLTNTD
jgi:hypothetical protein